MLPAKLVNEFWDTVCGLLVGVHTASRQEAVKAIADFRRIASHQVGDTIYNLGPERVAEMLAGAIAQGGFQEPEMGNVLGKKVVGDRG